MELYNIYCGFWEGMKEISVGGVPKWIYIVRNLKKRKSGLFKKTKWKRKRKKNGLEQKQKKKNDEKEKKNRSAIWALLCKVSGIDDIWKEKIVLH